MMLTDGVSQLRKENVETKKKERKLQCYAMLSESRLLRFISRRVVLFVKFCGVVSLRHGPRGWWLFSQANLLGQILQPDRGAPLLVVSVADHDSIACHGPHNLGIS